MATYAVYLPDGTVLGASESEDAEAAAEGVVNQIQWPEDTAVVDVNVGEITDPDYTLPDEIEMPEEGVSPVKTELAVKVHD